ncbi:galactosyl transferase GMA12/MNN10 family-domain-containing protein [Polychytrium aggregatum]|uniref:galactosyl transferase GMA12/MNN10 family-domain-containing protein n=1 Tax=Polychytrium aggregatum TaxID=110093 RepID=UPI0022FE38B2|nr:galactosyl transferase GMA12/MNN10 family-domain-containing protein [Polychytrium aggregatum]KAI9197062.1 galactosyl transferase GMA12/MNN10 family-domain-containing protein [Polychytrium aggregatum]
MSLNKKYVTTFAPLVIGLALVYTMVVMFMWRPSSTTGLASTQIDCPTQLASINNSSSNSATFNQRPKIAILLSYSGDVRDMSIERHSRVYIESVISKQEYARRHGYAFFLDSVIDQSRPHWGRLVTAYSILNSMPWIEWIMYMDIDTIIMDPSQNLEDLILKPYLRPTSGEARSQAASSNGTRITDMPPKDYQEIDFIGKTDCSGRPLNNGVYFIRNTNWTVSMLKKTFNDRTDYVTKVRRPGVQDAMTNTLLSYTRAEARHFLMGPKQATYNKFTKVCTGDPQGKDHWYEDGDFVIHFAGVVNREDMWAYYIRKMYSTNPSSLHYMLNELDTKWSGTAKWVSDMKELAKKIPAQ